MRENTRLDEDIIKVMAGQRPETQKGQKGQKGRVFPHVHMMGRMGSEAGQNKENVPQAKGTHRGRHRFGIDGIVSTASTTVGSGQGLR